MKTVTTRNNHPRRSCSLPYPNAATRQQLLDQFVELLLTGAIGIGAAAIVLFILVLA